MNFTHVEYIDYMICGYLHKSYMKDVSNELNIYTTLKLQHTRNNYFLNHKKITKFIINCINLGIEIYYTLNFSEMMDTEQSQYVFSIDRTTIKEKDVKYVDRMLKKLNLTFYSMNDLVVFENFNYNFNYISNSDDE